MAIRALFITKKENNKNYKEELIMAKKENMISIPGGLDSLVKRAQGVEQMPQIPPIGGQKGQSKMSAKIQKAMEGSKEWQNFVDSTVAFKRNKTYMETILIDKDMKNIVEFLKSVVGEKVTAKDVVSGIVRAFAEQNKDIINETIAQRQLK